MSFDLYFASCGNKDMELLLEKKHCNRLFTQLEKSSIRRCIEMKTRRNPSKLFIDSGAFTSWTKGISVDVDGYIDYINSLDDKITICAQVDCIPGKFGRIRTQKEIEESPIRSWENYLYMKEKLKSRDKLIPIFHQEESFEHLKKMLEYRHSDGTPISYIGISPSNDRSQADKEDFIARSFYIIKHSSNPNVKTHAFGMSNLSILERYPNTSADSTSWKMSAAFGSIMTRLGTIVISSEQLKDKKHIEYMPSTVKEYVKSECLKYGIDYDMLYTDFGTRAKFNINYLKDWADNYEYKPVTVHKKSLF